MNKLSKLLLPGGILLILAAGIFVTHLAKAQTAIIVNGATYQTVEEALQAAIPSDRATIKGEQIAKIKTIAKVERGDYWIEVVDMKPRENGVDIFARAWDKNNNLIGFGEDGSVEIEHFIIINPPILVPDLAGEVVRTWTNNDGIVIERRYREDLGEALLQSLEHTLSVKKQKYGPAYVVPGKIGNTTTTVYPDPDPETNTVDGRIFNAACDCAWATIRSGAGTGSVDTNTNEDAARIVSGVNTNQWATQVRSIYGFLTSNIPDTDVISSATFSLVGSSVESNFSQSVVVDRNIPASATALAASDFNIGNWDAVEQATGRITIASWSISGYNDFTLNGTGIGNVNKAGVSWFGIRLSGDFDNSEPTWVGSTAGGVNNHYADQTGTTQDPKLVVEHSAAAPVLSNLAYSNVTSSGADITWTTDVSADSEVTYDTSSPVAEGDPSEYDATASTTHSVSLTGLSANTTYYFFASSTASGLSGTSTESSFTTPVVDIEDLHADNIGSGWADIRWTTESTADSKVWYSLTSPVSATNFTEVSDATATTTHRLYLSGLLHNAVYYYRAVSGSGGNFATSSERTFNTTSTALCTD
ncbi:MAG: fibronectin type III domain-containing protein [Parcubacteria group bacterium]|nr:fibronectin type III domain-containing protein [Parcubacteria group bacterium]